ncbi:MAG TPA: AAA family ATPase [Geomobilimonas sp.]|nr:AAA family ATPase [Geomobilimonas sp.]
MYCTYFGFREKPFTITPNPRFVFLSKNHREAFAHLLYGIDNHGGFIVLTGEVGTGKTTVLRTVMEKLDDGQYRTALIFNPCISPLELLRSINREYGLPAEGLDNADLLDHLNRFLLEENRAGRTVVLVIDEAQNLPPQTLEQIRLISNLETDTDKLIQIVLAGQPELERLMSRPELRQLAQRVSVRYHLLPLDFEDARAYIDHRVTVAGGKGAAAFSRGALQRIFRRAGGVPRLINVACDRALLIGYTDEKRNISASMAQRAIKEIGDFGKTGWSKERLRTAWTCLLIVAAVATLIAAFHRVQRKPAPPAVVDPPSSPSAAKKVSPLSAKSVILPANDDFAAAVRWELSNTGESANAVHAFNALAKGWHVRQVKAGRKLSLPADLELLAAQRGLRLARMDTDLATLLRFDVPALLEIPLSGKKNRRYLALTGMNAQGVSVSPPLLGKSSFSEADLKRFWSGRAYVPWKDFNQLAHATATDASRVEILRLQILLAEAKTYGHEPTGVYDEGTMNAVKEFQKGHGIPEDGRAEETTLLLLYRDAGRFAMPRLTGKENRQKR